MAKAHVSSQQTARMVSLLIRVLGDEASPALAKVALRASGRTSGGTARKAGRRAAHPPARHGTTAQGATREARRGTPPERPGETAVGAKEVRGQLRDDRGRYAVDPDWVPPKYTRDNQYPSGYSEATHHEMARRYTLEGAEHGGWPKRDGQRVPKEELTWHDGTDLLQRDEHGRYLDEITYDHDPSALVHWIEQGRFSPRSVRLDYYDDPEHLRPMFRSENSRLGARLPPGTRYDDYPPGQGYTPD